MIRWLGTTLAIVLLVELAPQTRGQTAVGVDSRVSMASREFPVFTYGDFLGQFEPYGGFGLEFMQAPFPGAVVVDRFGLVHIAAFAPLPSLVTAQRPRTKASSSVPSGRAARRGNQLPTGSLDWPGASGVVAYSPALRYRNYGAGYGRGPYGSFDCGMMYKGMSLGY